MPFFTANNPFKECGIETILLKQSSDSTIKVINSFFYLNV